MAATGASGFASVKVIWLDCDFVGDSIAGFIMVQVDGLLEQGMSLGWDEGFKTCRRERNPYVELLL